MINEQKQQQQSRKKNRKLGSRGKSKRRSAGRDVATGKEKEDAGKTSESTFPGGRSAKSKGNHSHETRSGP